MGYLNSKTCLGLVLALATGCGSSSDSSSVETPTPTSVATPAVAAPTPPAAPAAPGTAPPAAMVATDLTPAGLPGLSIDAPIEAGGRVFSSSGSARIVQPGSNFAIYIEEGTFDQARTRSLFQEQDPAGSIAVDQPDLVVAQRSGADGLLFKMGVTVGDKHYICASHRTMVPFTRTIVDLSVASCRTLRATAP